MAQSTSAARADAFAGNEREEKASARFGRKDSCKLAPELVLAEGFDGVDAAGAAGGDVAGKQRGREEDRDHRSEG